MLDDLLMEKIGFEVRGRCARAGHRGCDGSALPEDRHLGGHLGNLLSQLELLMLDSHQSFLEELVLPLDSFLLTLELFYFLSLSLSRGLGSLTVSENTLDPALLLLVFSLCSFSKIVSFGLYSSTRLAYRGGRLVFGVGSSWPHDFRFFVGLLSSCSSLTSSQMESGVDGVIRFVSANDTVAWGG